MVKVEHCDTIKAIIESITTENNVTVQEAARLLSMTLEHVIKISDLYNGA